jgi:DNA (cytosine-5)-methyltransferase 1
MPSVYATCGNRIPGLEGMNEEIRTLDLFSGIGGFSLGLERAGPFRTVAFCEQDAYAQRVLKKHWPEVPIYDDVRTIDTDGLGRIDLICGGFPCQPWSVAGQQRGAEDDRDLWPAMVALIEELRPQWVIGENVRGFINQPMGLQRSLSDLESIGYEAVPFIIPACAVDAPHRRDRVWIVANAQRERGPGRMLHAGNELQTSTGGAADTFSTGSTRPKIVAEATQDDTDADGQRPHRAHKHVNRSGQSADGQEREPGSVCEVLAGSGNTGKRRSAPVGDTANQRYSIRKDIERKRSTDEQEQQSYFRSEPSGSGEDVADATSEGLEGRQKPKTTRQPLAVPASSGKHRKDVSDARRGCGKGPRSEFSGKSAPIGWLPEPDVGRVAHGISNRVDRLKCLGNAVVPQVVEQIGRAILEGQRR